MTLPLPSVFHPKLHNDVLHAVAQWLLEEFYATQDDLVRDTDTGWNRGCTSFGRQRSRILAEWKSGKHDWLDIQDPSNALVFTISGIPCRFSNDDPENPSKVAVIRANPAQMSFMPFVRSGEPARFCFVLDRGIEGLAEASVTFMGFSEEDVLVCSWKSGGVRAFEVIGRELPAPVEIEKAAIVPKQLGSEQDDKDDGPLKESPEQP